MPPPAPLRLLLYDRTCLGSPFNPGLSTSWRWGARLYLLLGRLDAWHGAATWEEGLEWLATVGGERRIGEIQFWGHGQPGRVLLDRRPLDETALDPAHPLQARLRAIRERLDGPDSLWWFRTCSTFRGDAGHTFARAWTDYFRCRTAGHTRVIGPLQGGLHSLAPGSVPTWSVAEGSTPPGRLPEWLQWHANTITCLGGRIPAGW